VSDDFVNGKGLRLNDNKPRIDLVPSSVLYEIAKVLEYGTKKYEEHNWRKGMKWSVPYACAMRHLLKFWEGEDVDSESGESHLGHVLCNILMLIEYSKICTNLDDRYKGPMVNYKDYENEEV